jgi:hypothetical protein
MVQVVCYKLLLFSAGVVVGDDNEVVKVFGIIIYEL